MSHQRLAVLGVAAGILAGAGCGGSAQLAAQQSGAKVTGPPSAKSTLTRAELIAKADLICFGVNAKRAAIKFKTPQDYARVVPPLAAYERAAVAQLRSLVPPPSMTSDWHEIVAGIQALAQVTLRGSQYATNNVNGFEGTQSLAADARHAEQQITSAASRQGFKDCAHSS